MKLRAAPSILGLAAMLGTALSGGAIAGTVKGRLTDNGKPVVGAMVTAFAADDKRRDTVYSDADGHYSLTFDFAGKIKVRVRAPSFMDAVHEIDLPMEGENTLDYQLNRQTDAAALSDSLTASAHLTAI